MIVHAGVGVTEKGENKRIGHIRRSFRESRKGSTCG